jgi:transcriptional regulator with XRE-family HTH domain
MSTSSSVVSRIESGQHASSFRTLKRLAAALEGRAVLGIDFGPPDALQLELVSL